MSIAFLVIGLLIAIGSLSAEIVFSRQAIRNGTPTIKAPEFYKIIGTIAGFGAGAGFLAAAVNTWGDAWKMDNGHATMSILGAGLFAVSFLAFWTAFAFYYYKPAFDKKQKKISRILTFAAIPLALAFFLLFGEGVAPYLSYPLINGVVFGGDAGFYFSTPLSGHSGGVHIMWYAVFILTGVAVCYFVSDHEFYKKYGRHGILEVLVVVAFLCGIIGARLWYVVGNWTRDGFDKDFWSVFAIWDGGLTIIGGAALGIVGGVLFIALNKKYKFIDIPWAMGVIVPTILLAQGIGRWGNFFNAEVHGVAVELSSGWQWLPTWIARNMQYSSVSNSLTGTTMIYVPLFLIESVFNIAGYFIIRYGICTPLKNYLAKGDAAGFYFIYYGIIRFIMEPLRDENYNMGNDNNFSVWGSLAYIFIGLALIAAFEVWKYLRYRKAVQVAGAPINYIEFGKADNGWQRTPVDENGNFIEETKKAEPEKETPKTADKE